jgi:hypothetical protein
LNESSFSLIETINFSLIYIFDIFSLLIGLHFRMKLSQLRIIILMINLFDDPFLRALYDPIVENKFRPIKLTLDVFNLTFKLMD